MPNYLSSALFGNRKDDITIDNCYIEFAAPFGKRLKLQANELFPINMNISGSDEKSFCLAFDIPDGLIRKLSAMNCKFLELGEHLATCTTEISVIYYDEEGEMQARIGAIQPLSHDGQIIYSAIISQGNSGAPLINKFGKVIGMHRGKIRDSNFKIAVKINPDEILKESTYGTLVH